MDKELIYRLSDEAERLTGLNAGADRHITTFAALVAQECVRLCEQVRNEGDECKPFEDTHKDGHMDGCNNCMSAIFDTFVKQPSSLRDSIRVEETNYGYGPGVERPDIDEDGHPRRDSPHEK